MAQETPQFEDFELLIGVAHQPGLYPVTILTRQAGDTSGTLALDPAAPEIKSALDAIAERDTTEDLLRQFGRRLFDALLAGPIGNQYRRRLGGTVDAGKRLRLRLRIEPPEIAALPWEFLYDPDADLPLAISPDHCLSRYVPVDDPLRVSATELPLRILIVISDPSDLGQHGMPPLNAAQEINRIQAALEERAVTGQIKADVLTHAVAADLRQKLRTFRPHVVHFIGHGGFQNDQGMLVMEDEDHLTRFVSDRQFREFFLGTEDVKLVILNACQGATQSSTKALAGLAPQVVRRGLGAVVAMQYPIPDKVSLSFAREFYRALAEYYPVDAAVAEGRRAVYQDFGSDRPDWGTPVIFMRSPDGLLFSPPQARQEPAAQAQAGPGSGKVATSKSASTPQPAFKPTPSPLPAPETPKPATREKESNKKGPPMTDVSPQQLREALIANFNLDELRTLCDDLRDNLDDKLDFDNLGGEGKAGKARELVDYLRRHGLLPASVDYIRQNYTKVKI